MNKIKFSSLFVVFALVGCSGAHSSAWQAMQDSTQKIRQSITQSSNNFTYTNKDLDLKFIELQVNQIKLEQADLLADERDFGQKVFVSAELFYLSELFERNYTGDNLTGMQSVRAEISELLDERAGANDLLAEMDDFILAEESYKKYLAGEIDENKFSETLKKAESDKLFELFYQFIDTEILFGSGGIDFQK